MVATVAKWGNSLAVRIPANLAKEINLSEGSEITLSLVNGTLVVKPHNDQISSLQELVKGINPENLHAEVDTGVVVGSEVW